MAVGRLYEMVRKGPSQPVVAACGPRPRGDTQEVTKKPASRRGARVYWPAETAETDLGGLYETVRRRWMWPPGGGLHRGSGRNPLEAILVDRATGLRALLDTGQRLQRPYRARACSGR